MVSILEIKKHLIEHAVLKYNMTQVFVPYTGATANIDIGAYDFTTTGTGEFGNISIIASGGGSITLSGDVSDDLVINIDGGTAKFGSSILSCLYLTTSSNSRSLSSSDKLTLRHHYAGAAQTIKFDADNFSPSLGHTVDLGKLTASTDKFRDLCLSGDADIGGEIILESGDKITNAGAGMIIMETEGATWTSTLEIEDRSEGIILRGTTTTSGVNRIYIDGSLILLDGDVINFGNSGDFNIQWNTGGNDKVLSKIGVGSATQSGNWIFGSGASTSFNSPVMADPTLRIVSGDINEVDKEIFFRHNQTDGVIETGSGGIQLIPAAGFVGMADNIKLDFGATNTDLQIYSDGTNGIIDVATALRLGNNVTNYMEVSATGDVVFVGGAGLCFADMYGADVADVLTIDGTTKTNKVQITSFAVDGVSNNCTPDHTSDHITITKAGMYLCNVSMHINSVSGGTAEVYGYSVYKNGGTGEFVNLHGQRNMAGSGGDEGSISLSGIIDLAVDDTIEVWIWNNTNTDNVEIDDINLSLVQIGGT